MMGWDNSARREENWSVWYGFSLGSYYAWLRHIVKYTRSTFASNRRFVFINAWNEWAEGTYLEPDRHFGYACLNTTSRALFDLPLCESPTVLPIAHAMRRARSIAIHAHVYFLDLLDEMSSALQAVDEPYDLYVTCDTEAKAAAVRQAFGGLAHASSLEVIVTPNRGRDVAPFLCTIAARLLKYDYIAHIHTKKSETVTWGDRWRIYLLSNLFPRAEGGVRAILDHLAHKRVGIVYPPAYPLIAPFADWGGQRDRCERLLQDLGCERGLPQSAPLFPAGNMFWAKVEAVRPILQHAWSYDDFEEESGQIVDTLGHCIERIWSLVAADAGFTTTRALAVRTASDPAFAVKDRLALFSHFSPSGLSDADLFLIKQLRTQADTVVLVSNSPLTREEISRAKTYCMKIIVRENTGFDFGAWRDAIHELGWAYIGKFSSLILVNNSCFGPTLSLNETFSEMETRPCDFWGLTAFPRLVESHRAEAALLPDRTIPPHLQSYFLVFRRAVVASEAFRDFWDSVIDCTDILEVIAQYEVKLTGILTESGFVGDCYIPEAADLQSRHQADVEYNAAYSDPLALTLVRHPFVKKKVWKYAPEQLKELRRIVKAFDFYPSELIPEK